MCKLGKRQSHMGVLGRGCGTVQVRRVYGGVCEEDGILARKVVTGNKGPWTWILDKLSFNYNKPSKDMSKTLRPDALIVEDWIFDSEDETEIEPEPKQREPSSVKYSKHVKYSRESVKKVEHPKQAANLRTNNQKSRGHKTNWNNKACFVYRSLNHLIKDYDYYE
nr:hypothetical protein [Tanacetum cinerariifolium]